MTYLCVVIAVWAVGLLIVMKEEKSDRSLDEPAVGEVPEPPQDGIKGYQPCYDAACVKTCQYGASFTESRNCKTASCKYYNGFNMLGGCSKTLHDTKNCSGFTREDIKREECEKYQELINA